MGQRRDRRHLASSSSPGHAEQCALRSAPALFTERSERIGNSFRMNIYMRRGDDITQMGPLKREAAPVWKPE